MDDDEKGKEYIGTLQLYCEYDATITYNIGIVCVQIREVKCMCGLCTMNK